MPRLAELTRVVVKPRRAEVELLEAFKRDVLPALTDAIARDIAAVVERFGQNLLASLQKVLKARTGPKVRRTLRAHDISDLLKPAEATGPALPIDNLPELEEQATEIALPTPAIERVLDQIFPTD